MSWSSFVSGIADRATEAFDPHDEREFLPAALEVLETPASPTGRLLGSVIILFFVCAVAWSLLGKVDIIATAPGRVLPAGEVKTIQPLYPGVVVQIAVADGDRVKAGQLLVALDPTQAGADQDRLQRDLLQAQLDVARLTALKDALTSGRAPVFEAPKGATIEMIEEASAAMRAQADRQASALAGLDQQVGQKSAEAAEVSARIDEVNSTLPMLSEKERIHHDLMDQGYGTSLSYLDAQQQLSQARHELAVEAQRRTQAEAARTALERQRDEQGSQYAADLLSDLRKAEEQRGELAAEVVKATDISKQSALTSPIDGVVEQLAVHTLHGVVTPAQPLMIIVPDNDQLTVNAQLQNRDVGFVHAGQPVKIKVETFDFTQYGLLDGHVIGVSRDTVEDVAQRQPPIGQGGRAEMPSYIARIALQRSEMIVDGRRENLQPGMAITAEIKTGQRTIMDYLLSPLARKAQESLHER